MLSFRVTEDEFRKIMANYQRTGSESLSDFAREILVKQRDAYDGPDGRFMEALLKLEHRIKRMESLARPLQDNAATLLASKKAQPDSDEVPEDAEIARALLRELTPEEREALVCYVWGNPLPDGAGLEAVRARFRELLERFDALRRR